MKKQTLLTIANSTGLSVSTVSRVLSGKGEKYRISKATIEKVKIEALKSHYVPDLVAKGLRTKRTDIIGLVVPDIGNPFFASLSSIIIGDLKKLGYNVLLADSMESASEEAIALNMFVSRKVDGIIAVPVSKSPDLLENISKTVPVVLADRYFPDAGLPYFCTDNYAGSLMATNYLLEKGYKRILAVRGLNSVMPDKERVRGFLSACKSCNGKCVDYEIEGNMFSVRNGYDVTGKALSSAERPDAIFAFSSNILLGALMAVKEHGISVPDEIGLISFDNNGFFDYLNPAVTRIEQPLKEIGSGAVNLLNDMIRNGNKARDTVKKLIQPALVVRSSC
ncbi:MAG: LacI family transcriptional regulator [Bacteroidales bacterium]|jgi:LacI family transcriptional regulator|nr:LacI family transcriptional regulator [Bacteroidales bacterium]MCI1785526.1 LacI family transcriptional regulator [Bacteroidales bacterium]